MSFNHPLLDKHDVTDLDLWQFERFKKPYAFFRHSPNCDITLLIKVVPNSFTDPMHLSNFKGDVVDILEFEGRNKDVIKSFYDYINNS